MPKDVAELCALFDLTATGRLTFRGPQPQTLLQRLFGGQVLGQTLVAAAQTVPRDRLVHSLNAYFLRPEPSTSRSTSTSRCCGTGTRSATAAS
nr:acyl-CoA thioesterase domain-containing protein [Tessaracoccus sp.]